MGVAFLIDKTSNFDNLEQLFKMNKNMIIIIIWIKL